MLAFAIVIAVIWLVNGFTKNTFRAEDFLEVVIAGFLAWGLGFLVLILLKKI